jgi:hypothetical protein
VEVKTNKVTTILRFKARGFLYFIRHMSTT